MSLAADDPRHGTHNGYKNYGCRCDPCRAAMSEYMRGRVSFARAWRHRTGRHMPRDQWLEQIKPDHGTDSRYSGGCRCAKCREAARVARADRRAKEKLA